MNSRLDREYISDQGVGFRDLFDGIKKQWLLVVSITLLVTLCTTIYVFLETPLFETRTYLRSVDPGALDQLNATKVYELKPDEALARVSRALSSYDNRFEFFQQNPELFDFLKNGELSGEQTFSRFNDNAFTVLYPKPNEVNYTGFVGLSLVYSKGIDGVEIVNKFVTFVLSREQDSINNDLKNIVANRLASVESRIEADRAKYQATKSSKIASLIEQHELKKAELQDRLRALKQQAISKKESRIAELEEAISIAHSLGIRKPTLPFSMGNVERGQSIAIRTEISERGIPLYFMGSDVLEAEKDVLLKRNSDEFTEPQIAAIRGELLTLSNNREVDILRGRADEDLYLQDLAKLKEEAAWLKSIKLNTESLKLVRLDQPAQQPLSPIKPKRGLIISLGIILGFSLGIFVALLRFFSRHSITKAL